MTPPDELIRIFAPLAFKAADKFFKFTSWLIIVVGIRYAATVTGENVLIMLDWVATCIYGVALISQVFYLGLRDPSSLGVPPSHHAISRRIQFGTAIALVLVVTSPALFMDRIIEGLEQAHTARRDKP